MFMSDPVSSGTATLTPSTRGWFTRRSLMFGQGWVLIRFYLLSSHSHKWVNCPGGFNLICRELHNSRVISCSVVPIGDVRKWRLLQALPPPYLDVCRCYFTGGSSRMIEEKNQKCESIQLATKQKCFRGLSPFWINKFRFWTAFSSIKTFKWKCAYSYSFFFHFAISKR